MKFLKKFADKCVETKEENTEKEDQTGVRYSLMSKGCFAGAVREMRHFKPFTAVLLLILVGCSSTTSAPNTDFVEHYIGTPLGNSSTIACTFEWIDEMTYEQDSIHYKPALKQKKPLVFIFSDLDTEEPKIQAVGSDNSLYESTPAFLANTEEKIVLAELTPIEKNLFVYVIHKNTGVATWTKQYQWPGGPIGTLSMGKCSSR